MRLLAVVLMCVLGLTESTSSGLRAAALPHDAYIWQRAWKPAVLAAAQSSADLVRAWRVLAAEADPRGRWTTVEPKWRELADTGRPLIAVIRIDGRIDDARMPELLERTRATITDVSGAVALLGVEIDYDCPTSKLPVYARFLAELRRFLPDGLRVSITALPTWMNSTDIGLLGRDVDELVLQVHAVDDPSHGLFDPERAERWVRAFGRRLQRPFRVALPAYDVRVTWGADGRLAGVEGEVPLRTGPAAESATLAAAPQAVQRFLQALERRPPDGLQGIVWFRLPTDSDRRAWSLATWRAVVRGQWAATAVVAELSPTDNGQLWTVTLSNSGAVDGKVPREVRLATGCTAADGANGFHLKPAGTVLVLESSGTARLRAGSRRAIGWARCVEPKRQLNVVN